MLVLNPVEPDMKPDKKRLVPLKQIKHYIPLLSFKRKNIFERLPPSWKPTLSWSFYHWTISSGKKKRKIPGVDFQQHLRRLVALHVVKVALSQPWFFSRIFVVDFFASQIGGGILSLKKKKHSFSRTQWRLDRVGKTGPKRQIVEILKMQNP